MNHPPKSPPFPQTSLNTPGPPGQYLNDHRKPPLLQPGPAQNRGTVSPLSLPSMSLIPRDSGSAQDDSGHQTVPGFDTTGQIAPPGKKPRVTGTLWEDEGTLCFQVEAKGVYVARREDSHMINGTKLLNVAGMTRGRRDGILKSEHMKQVVKDGPMHLKGVWVPFERALYLANKEGITELLYPLFVLNIGALLYHPEKQTRNKSVMASPENVEKEQFKANPVSNEIPTTHATKPTSADLFTKALAASSFEYAQEFFSLKYNNSLTNSGLPLLRIPYEPSGSSTTSLSYSQDLWCTSESDSISSNMSEGSQARQRWVSRGRSDSLLDWPLPAIATWSTTPKDLHSPPLDEYLDQYEAHISLDVPFAYRRYNMESPAVQESRTPDQLAFSSIVKLRGQAKPIAVPENEYKQSELTLTDGAESSSFPLKYPLNNQELPNSSLKNDSPANSPSSNSRQSDSCDPSSFETDSSFSDNDNDETGVEDDESDDLPNVLDILDMISEKIEVREMTVVDSALTKRKRALVDFIMKDFWSIFTHEWSSNFRKCTANPSHSSNAATPPLANFPTLTSVSGQNKRKCPSDDGNDEAKEDDNQDPKRPRKGSYHTEPSDQPKNFACPYRKRNPQKYNHSTRSWRTCALTAFDTIPRLKGHLYRHHRCFQCERCGESFKDENTLKGHFMAVKACDLRDFTPADGITGSMEKQLRSRKKTHATQTQEQKWEEIYRILFPMGFVPSPYFEEIKDEISQSPSAMELSSYEEYSRQELPRVFRGALEAVVNEQAQPIVLLCSLPFDMIQEAQNHVFSTYRSRQASHMADSPLPDFPPEIESLFSFEPPNTNQEQKQNSNPGSLDMLQNLYQEPPYQTQLQSTFEPKISEEDFAGGVEKNSSFDSGYMSDILGLFDSASNSMEFTTGIGFNPGSQHLEVSQASGNVTREGETSKDFPMPWGMDERAWFSSNT